MSHTRDYALAIAAFLAVVASASAEAQVSTTAGPATAASPDVALQHWVAQLADDAYQVREMATRQLIEAGLAARPAVTAALADPDPEVRLRCRRILAQIEQREEAQLLKAFLEHENPAKDDGPPGWSAFREVAGESADTRKWFAGLYQAERQLLGGYRDGGRDLNELFAARFAEAQQNLNISIPAASGTRRIPLKTALALLFVAGDDKVSLEGRGVQLLVNQSEVQQWLASGEDCELPRKLLGRVVARGRSRNDRLSKRADGAAA